MNEELYQEVLLQHSRRPKNLSPLPGATHRAEGVNALCGDEITIELTREGDTLRAVHFQGSGCAICTASASILTCETTGLRAPEARALAEDFRRLAVSGEAAPAVADRPRLAALGTVHRYPQRVKCATLAWETLLAALDHPV